MRSPAHDIAVFLAGGGFGAIGQELHISREPVSPDFVTTLYDTGGNDPVLVTENLRQPTLQIRVRGFDYAACYERQEDIFLALSVDVTDFETTDYRYVGCWLTSDIISIGRDDNDRHLLTANYRLERHAKEKSA